MPMSINQSQQVAGSGGHVHHALQMQNGAYGIELATNAAIAEGEVLVRLPRRLQLTEDCDNAPSQLTGVELSQYTRTDLI